MNRRNHPRLRPRPAPHPLALALLLALAAPLAAQELPSGGVVQSGSATIGPGAKPGSMTIQQGTQNAVIHWGSFSIGSNGTVTFEQPGTSSIALNRVIDGPSSRIDGSLLANGRVFLVNPSGVLFGRTAQVNVGGLVASTLEISDDDFAAGLQSGRFEFSGGRGQVRNEGAITAADGGTVALIGDSVRNLAGGTIQARLGSIVMGSGSLVTLDFHGDGLTQLIVDGARTDSDVRNAGELTADGGAITLAALADDDGDGLSIEHTGTIRARTIENRQGRILLTGGDDVELAGAVIDATGDDAGERGGRVTINGGNVGLFGFSFPDLVPPVFDPNLINVSGQAGGGSVEVTADNVLAMNGFAFVLADASAGGDGGSIRLLGGTGARLFGGLSARGGAAGGNGGLIETSASGGIDLRGVGIDASAANGTAGTWLIDPFDVEITHGSATGSLPSNPFEAVAASVIQDGDINRALDAGSSVRITTGSGGLANDGDITFTADAAGVPVSIVRTTGTARLSFQLDANRAIRGTGLTIDAGGGPLDVLFNANANNTAVPTSNDAGIVLFDADIRTNGGNLWFYGQGDPVNGLAGGEEEGIELSLSTIDTRGATGDGEVRLRARGGNLGVGLFGTTVQSGAGDISVFGTTVFSGTGVLLANYVNGSATRSLLQSDSGDISIVGLALASFPGSSQVGVELRNSAVASVSGSIDLFGRAQGSNGASAPGSAVGVLLGNTAEITSLNGERIRLVGESTLANPAAPALGAGVHLTAGCGFDSAICVNGGASGRVILQAGNTGTTDALIIAAPVQTGGVVNLRPGGVDATGAAYDRSADAVTLGGAGAGFDVSNAELALIDAPELVVGSSAHAGAIAVQSALERSGNLSLHNTGGAGGIRLDAAVDVGTGTLALVSGGSVSQGAAGAITAGSLLARSTGADVTLDNPANNVAAATLAGDAATGFTYVDADALAIGSVGALGFDAAGNTTQALSATGINAGGAVLVRNLAGNLTLNAGVGAGGNIDLVTAGTLQNVAGAALTAGGTWRVWADTWLGEARGGLAGSGPLPNLYNCQYAGACGVVVPATGNHFIYRQQPLATVTLDSLSREYGLANPALTFAVGGLILGDLAANAIAGAPSTTATQGSNVGSYPITGSFASPAGYAIQLVPGTLGITAATLVYIANPFTRFVGQPNGVLGGSVSGLRNNDTLAGATTGTLAFTSPANPFSPVGTYAIDGSGLQAQNYVFVQDPGNATALNVIGLPGTPFLPEYVREPPDSYLYDRNIGAAPMCLATDLLAGTQARQGDNLAREWSRVRSRPNLTNCVQANRRNGCADF